MLVIRGVLAGLYSYVVFPRVEEGQTIHSDHLESIAIRITLRETRRYDHGFSQRSADGCPTQEHHLLKSYLNDIRQLLPIPS
jgi:hypothetical protein